MEKYLLKVTASYNDVKKEGEEVKTITSSIFNGTLEEAINESNNLIDHLSEKFSFTFKKKFSADTLFNGADTICANVNDVIIAVTFTTLYVSDVDALIEHAFKSQKEYDEWEKR